MCGIAGSFYFNKLDDRRAQTIDLSKALEKIKYRGPDDTGILVRNGCQLGHVRLKILDLSPNASQPMSDDTGRYHLIFNGEIFNYVELRTQLSEEGCSFRSHSDTEVLLQGLKQHGKNFLDRLNGFFAFALYDSHEHKLLIARDRYGEKPLYFVNSDDAFHFASDLDALNLLHPTKEIDQASLAQLLQLTYVPGPSCIVQHIKKLDPGHTLELSESGINRTTWYELHKSFQRHTANTNIEDFRVLMQNSVAVRLHADVPVCVFLSGGVDSSVIAALSAKQNREIISYSAAFPDSEFFDESKYAKSVAEHLGIKNEIIPLTDQDMLDELILMQETGSEPFADSSAVAFGALSRKISSSVRVALTGDGADELLGGYNKHQALIAASENNLINMLVPMAAPIVNLISASRNNAWMNKIRQAKKYASIVQADLKERYVKLASWNDANLCQQLLTADVSLRLGARFNSFIQDINTTDYNSVLMADQRLVLANDMLVKADRMSMRHGLEIRAPFLDYRVVEYLNGLQFSKKVGRGDRKIILREGFSKELPDHVFNRPKRGFEIPLDKWLRGKLKPLVLDTISGNNLTSTDLLKRSEVEKVLRDFYTYNKSEHAHLIYALLLFEHWYKNNAHQQKK
jgi:asparagine synthase (glutamine-hydrolysing)